MGVTLANDSEFGLSASVWTRDVDRSLRIAQALEAGSDGSTIGQRSTTVPKRAVSNSPASAGSMARPPDFIEYKHIALRPGLMT